MALGDTGSASEERWVAALRHRFGTSAPGVRLGIGDDAAVLEAAGEPWVLSVDTSVEGVHFECAWLGHDAIGYRAFQAAASDLAAMGARPVAALSSLIVPRGCSAQDLDALTHGQLRASRECACPVVGGNLSRGSNLSVTTTVMGTAPQPLRRTGARPGDELWLVGELGMAAAGLSWLRLGRAATDSEALAACVRAWRSPEALISRGLALRTCASACIDVSDGLAADAARLARESRVAVLVNREKLEATLMPPLRHAARQLQRAPLPWALRGGEDYALLVTGRASRRPAWAKPIGRVGRGSGAFLESRGVRHPLAGGYDHLRGSAPR